MLDMGKYILPTVFGLKNVFPTPHWNMYLLQNILNMEIFYSQLLVKVLKILQNPQYLAYALSTTDARKQKSAGKVKSKVVHSSVPAIEALKIPVPPLEVQNEIVRILDNFTELTAELTARKK